MPGRRTRGIRAARAAGAILAVGLGLFAGGAWAQTRPFEPVGQWRFRHSDGSPFIGRLAPDHTAMTDFADGEHGIWRWEGNAVRMIYTDGWDDLLTKEADGRFTKRAWGPGADRCGPPDNSGTAEQISTDPGPPLSKQGTK